MIQVGDTVFHTLSKLCFLCENQKHERWMNMNPYYILNYFNETDNKFV